jgi:LPS export ABC transporter permease LptG
MRRTLFKKVDKLVALSVLGSVLLAWGFLVGFDAFHAFLAEINDIGTGQYTLSKAIVYILLTVPRRAYQFFGYSALIGGLLGMGGLASSGELTALRAAGLSKLRICVSVIISLTLMTAGVMLIGETIGPRGEQKAEAFALAAKSKDVAIGKNGSLWARDGDNVVNAKHGRTRNTSKGPVVELQDVRVFEFETNGHLSALSLAKTATQSAGEWTLNDVRRTEFKGTEADTTTQRIRSICPRWICRATSITTSAIIRMHRRSYALIGREFSIRSTCSCWRSAQFRSPSARCAQADSASDCSSASRWRSCITFSRAPSSAWARYTILIWHWRICCLR